MRCPTTRASAAIVAADGTYTYDDLDEASRRVAGALLGDNDDLQPDARRVPRGAGLCLRRRAARHLARRRRGGAAGRLASAGRARVRDPRRRRVGRRRRCRGSHPTLAPLATAARARFVPTADALQAAPADDAAAPRRRTRRAMIIYTSGTTGRPKGAVTHARERRRADRVAGRGLGLDAGRPAAAGPAAAPRARHHQRPRLARWPCAPPARSCRRSTPTRVWERLASGEITVFTAVPTIYSRLIAAWDAAPADVQRRAVGGRARACG